MVPKLIYLSALTVRRFGFFRDCIRIGLSRRHSILCAAVKQLGQLVRIESQERQIKLRVFQILQFAGEHVEVPFCDLAGLIVCDPICLHLFRGKIRRHMDRDFLQTELYGRFEARVAANDNHVAVHDDRGSPAELLDRFCNRVHRVVVKTRVLFIGSDIGNFHIFDKHIFCLSGFIGLSCEVAFLLSDFCNQLCEGS